MSVCEVRVHLEPVDDGEIAWWADSEQLPGLSATAPALPALLDLVREALVRLKIDLDEVWFELVGDDDDAALEINAMVTGEGVARATESDPPARTRILDTILVA